MRVLVFDSGIGGVGVAREIRRLLPAAGVAYLMDDAGFPYGARSDSDLVARVTGVVAAGLARLRSDLVVVACNTASTAALAALRAAHVVPFVGCVPPVKSAAACSRTKVIGVLATPATVRGRYLRELCARVAPECRVLVHGAAGLAALAEARFAGAAVSVADVRAEVAGLAGQAGADAMDAVALGCTHYAGLLPELVGCLAGHVRWVDPAPAVAEQVARVVGKLDVGGGAEGFDGVVLRTGSGCGLGAGWRDAGFMRVEGCGLHQTRMNRLS